VLHEVDDDYDDDDDDDDVLVKVAPVEFTSTFELKNDVQYCTAPCSLLFEVDSHINVQLHSRDGSTYHLHRVAVASLESRTKDHPDKRPPSRFFYGEILSHLTVYSFIRQQVKKGQK